MACTVCGSSASKKVIKSWLKKPCMVAKGRPSGGPGMPVEDGRGPRQNGDEPLVEDKPMAAVAVGRVDLDGTHALRYTRGFWWCAACGAYTTAATGHKSSAKRLRAACRRRPTAGGAYFLARLQQGYPPKPGLSWPTAPDLQRQGWRSTHRLGVKTSAVQASLRVSWKPTRRLWQKTAWWRAHPAALGPPSTTLP